MAIVQIFGMFAIGLLARGLGYVREEELNRWSHFIVDILFPLLVFHAIAEDFEASRLRELWPLPVIGAGIMALGGLVGWPTKYLMRSQDPDVRKTFHHFCAINNYGFLPLIIVINVWGEEALALLFFLNLGSNIAYWTIGVGILSGGDWRQAARNILSPTLIALLLALVLAMTGGNHYVPQVVYKVTGWAGGAAVPCMLIIIGASLNCRDLLVEKWDMAYLTIMRLALLPLVTVWILRLLPIAEDVYQLAVVVAVMPVAVSSTILTRRYGGSPDFAARAAVVITLVSLVTVPLTLAYLLKP